MKKYLFIIIIVAAFLRLYRIDQVPVSLFGDELDVGYQAYSILNTGRDYYGNFMPLHFHSLAEWRTPLYLYSVVPTVAIFGISPLGVRLPAAIFGILGVVAMFYLVRKIRIKYSGVDNHWLELAAAFILAVSPWHIQYSRAAFEVTQMLFLLMGGLYLVLYSLENKGKLLWLGTAGILLMPWSYSTAKVFTPVILLTLFVLFFRELIKLPKSSLIKTITIGLVLGLPLLYTILAGGGAQRFGYIGVFSDPTTESEIGAIRTQLAKFRGETGYGLQPTFSDRLFHNKFTVWGDVIIRNSLQPFSTDFLFLRGDLNLRHSIEGQGMFYRVEVITLLLGLIFFFTSKANWKIKSLIGVWITVGVLPAAITRDGGMHATRLILILPPLVFLLAYGVTKLSKKYLLAAYIFILAICFVIYQHNYWNINPWYSERWWHTGWEESVKSIKEIEDQYQNILISTADEPPWIFFAGWYEYPPAEWQENFPIGSDVEFEGFGRISHIGKFYFGSPQEGGLYDWGKVLSTNDLYLASAKEVNVNLIMEPERTPNDLELIRSISYPSGEPAFYLFSGKDEE